MGRFALNQRRGAVHYADGGSVDAFYRLRTSYPATIFDSKQLADALPLLWDDAETSGTGTGSSHDADAATTTLSVSDSTAGTRTRQTFQRFNYQPGKSQMVIMTGIIGAGSTGNTSRIGLFDDNNGIFFENAEGTMGVVIRSKASGSVVNTRVAQSAWNLNSLQNAAVAEYNIDWDQVQIFFFDFEWLGVGRVRMGLFVDGVPVYVHEFLHANKATSVYMGTPNLPLRYELANDGNGAAATLDAICCSVISEGGMNETGIVRYESTKNTAVSLATAGTVYAVMSFHLKTASLGATVLPQNVALHADGNIEWMLVHNPTFGSAPTWYGVTNSALFAAAGGQTITAGTQVAGGFLALTTAGNAASASTAPVKTAMRIGASISGVTDVITLAARPFSNSLSVRGGLTWLEQL